MRNKELYQVKPHCLLCPKEIPPDRLARRAVTCCEGHAIDWAAIKRTKIDNKGCRYCHKPSTPNSRTAFARFRKWERANPELARPVEWEIMSAAGMTGKEFGKALAQAARSDIEIDAELRDYDWGQVRKPKDLPTPELDRCLAILAAYVPPPEDVKESLDPENDS